MHGVYHLEPEAPCSWHEFAAAIFALQGRDVPVTAITAAEFGAPFARPAYSYLGSTRAPHLRHWREGLARYLREKGHLEGAPSTSP
jgi:dTDP-4-dehydrorhamnose reductase